MFTKSLTAFTLAAALILPGQAAAEQYKLDIDGAHAFIQFRIQHLGFSWLYGRFNKFEGQFVYDEYKPADASVSVTIDTASVDSNHAERDKHLRNEDFLYVDKYPQARFVSTRFEPTEEGGTLHGDLTLRGVTRQVVIDVQHVGHGDDPWGGYRRGFQGSTRFSLADFGIPKYLGPKSKEVELILSVEGIREE